MFVRTDERMDGLKKTFEKAQQCTPPYFPVWSHEENGVSISILSGGLTSIFSGLPGYEVSLAIWWITWV